MSDRGRSDYIGHKVLVAAQPANTSLAGRPSLSQKEREELQRRLSDTLRGKADGQLSAYFYTEPNTANDPVNGKSYHHDYIERKAYYPKEAEKKLFKDQEDKIEEIAPVSDIFVSLGGGDAQAFSSKDMKLIKASKATTVYLVDLSQEYLDQQERIIKDAIKSEELPVGTQVVKMRKDFTAAVKSLNSEGKFETQVSMCMTGLTLFNMGVHDEINDGNSYRTMINTINALIAPLPQNSSFYITQDTTTDRDKILEAYDAGELLNQWMKNFWLFVQREIPTEGLDVSLFEGRAVVPDAKSNQMQFQFVATRDATFIIGDEVFDVKKGDTFVSFTSEKFGIGKHDRVRDVVREAGGRHANTILGDDGAALRHFRVGQPGPA
tara:strand:+ start:172 stop:1308 length:1137 start_codon:yes stop_codon:yes gene_type:complete